MQDSAGSVDWAAFEAVLFDLDGVITPVAVNHEWAWAALFARWDFTPDVHLIDVDGTPRHDGVRSFLLSRSVDPSSGDPSAPPGDDTPDPTRFGRAARLVGADPVRSILVEDASSGVAAGPAGRIDLVLGIDRAGERQTLLADGADLVVDDLAEKLRGTAGVKWGGENADRLERDVS